MAVPARQFRCPQEVQGPAAPALTGGVRPASWAARLLTVQRAAGNKAVAKMLGPIVVQRQYARTNEAAALRSADLSHLLTVYVTRQDVEVVLGPGDAVVFTPSWLDGAGLPILEAAIRRRLDELAALGDPGSARLQQIAGQVRELQSGSAVRSKIWLQQAVTYRLENIVRPGRRYLSEQERNDLKREVGDRMGVAYTQFTTATRRQQAALKAQAADRAAMAALVVDVFMGLLAPGVGRAIAGLAGNLPIRASTVAYRAAVAALDESRNSRIFSAAWKFGNSALKSHLSAVYGEGDVDLFVAGLRTGLAEQLQAMRGRLDVMGDDELVVLAAAYDTSVANEQTYLEKVVQLTRQYRTDVQAIGYRAPIGSTGYPDYAFGTTTSAAWLRHNGRRRLALISVESNVAMTRGPRFVRWVSEEMTDYALAKMAARRAPVRELTTAQVAGAPR